MIAVACRSGNATPAVEFETPLLTVDPQASMNVD